MTPSITPAPASLTPVGLAARNRQVSEDGSYSSTTLSQARAPRSPGAGSERLAEPSEVPSPEPRPLSPPITRQLTAVYPRERIQSGLVGAFVQFAKRRLDAPPGEGAEEKELAISARSAP